MPSVSVRRASCIDPALQRAGTGNADAFSVTLTLLVLVYTFVPATAAFFQGPREPNHLAGFRHHPDALAAAGVFSRTTPHSQARARLPAQRGLWYRHPAWALPSSSVSARLPGMKFNLPSARDLAYGAAAFLACAPILIVAGRLLGFIPPLHAPAHPSPRGIGPHIRLHLRGYRAARRDSVPLADPELADATLRLHQPNAAGCRIHIRLRASG